ncbi:MAG: EAL domain-containing protein [Cellvibrionales bacterium]|nr:EAL domain-containing protein [Cellvibrionales bacterium]
MKTFNVLIQVSSAEESAWITGLYRDQDLEVRAHRVTSKEDLVEHLETSDWHLLVSDDSHKDFSLDECLILIKSQPIVLPVIYFSSPLSKDQKLQLVAKGVSTFLTKDEEALLPSISWALAEGFKAKIEATNLNEEVADLKAHTNHLMNENQAGIAYLAEGIIISSNQSFADILGFDDIEAIECHSLIDFVVDKDKLKRQLKLAESSDEEQSTDLSLKNAEGKVIQVNLTMKQAALNQEECLQLHMQLAAQSDISHGLGKSLEKIQSDYNDLTITQSYAESTFVIATLNDYSRHLDRLSYSGVDELTEKIAYLLEDFSQSVVSKIADDAYALLLSVAPNEAQASLEEFCKGLENEFIDCQGGSIAFSLQVRLYPCVKEDFTTYFDRAYSYRIKQPLTTETGVELIPLAVEKKSELKQGALTKELMTDENIHLMYQPIMSLRGEQKETYEVTYELQSDIEHCELPNDSTLDRWIVIEATKALAAHRDNGHDTRIAINLSGKALVDPSFAGWIKVVLKASNLPVESIILQFNESDVLQQMKQGVETCNALLANKNLVAINNFSEKEASLKLLKHIKPQFIHFNKGLTNRLSDDDIFEMVKSLVEKLNESNISSILSNVRNTAEMASLWNLGASYMTGSYLQEPAKIMAYEFADIH